MTYKTTKKDFKEFKAECERWVDYFGLKDWEIVYRSESDDECRGSCASDNTSRIAVIGLGKTFGDTPEKNEIKRVAFHEVCELLLSPLRLYGEERFTTESAMASSRHNIIRTLENTIFKEKTK